MRHNPLELPHPTHIVNLPLRKRMMRSQAEPCSALTHSHAERGVDADPQRDAVPGTRRLRVVRPAREPRVVRDHGGAVEQDAGRRPRHVPRAPRREVAPHQPLIHLRRNHKPRVKSEQEWI